MIQIPENLGKPVRGRILVQRDREIKVTVGGIHIPDNAREKLNEGYVLAISKSVVNKYGVVEPHSVKVGDRIIFGKYVGLEVKIDDNEYTIMNENEVLVILPPKSEEQIQREAEADSLLISLAN